MTTIAGFARQGGVSVETVRFYQRRGLLAVPSPTRGVRRYGAPDLQRLRFIRAARSAGFTLQEIRQLLALDQRLDRGRIQTLTRARIDSLDQTTAELTRSRDALVRLVTECGATQSGPGPIVAAFRP